MNLARAFQEKLAKLTFFDPACGSGNFLTESYLQLRELKNEAIKIQHPNPMLDVGQASDFIKVSIQQFYGIELNDFAVSVSKTAMWIAESQMWEKTKDIIYAEGDFLPLKTYVHIYEGDALKMDWNEVLPNTKCSYVLGNPPFVGALKMNKEQKADKSILFKGVKHAGLLDFVTYWYAKAAQYIQNTEVNVAFVSTDSIIQGSQVPVLWSFLFNQGVHINFAYRSFMWDSEAKIKAQVTCVIIGFSLFDSKAKVIFDHEHSYFVDNINPYLIDAPTVFIKSRAHPLCDVPSFIGGLNYGDGKHYLLTKHDVEQIEEKEPLSNKYIRPYLSDKNLLHGHVQYCLWFVNTKPNELKKMPLVLKHVAAVKSYRESFKGQNMRNYASRPLEPIRSQYYTIEHTHDALAVPLVSADRSYIPMTIVDKKTICSNMVYLLENPSDWLFGILESKMMMAWIHAVGSRLGTGYRFINTIVYNNFPFFDISTTQTKRISATAQAILDARKKYPDSSLADLYDPLIMPADLLKAHKENDKAVLSAYGLSTNATESEIVAHLFKMYEELTKK